MSFKKLKQKLKELGLSLTQSENTVNFDIIDVKKSFEGTGKSNTIKYTLNGEELDKMDSATMALLYAKYFMFFREPDTFISKEFLDAVKRAYPCKTPTKACLVDFLKNFSKKLKMNLFLIPLEGGSNRAFKFKHSPSFDNKSIYFDFETLMGALSIPNSDLPLKTSYQLRIKDWVNEEGTRRSRPDNGTRKKPKEDPDEPDESEDEPEDEPEDESEDEPEDESDESEDEPEESEDEPDESDDDQDAAKKEEVPEEAVESPRKGTQKAISSEELDMYNKIIDSPLKMADYVRTATDTVMLTRKQQSGLMKYPERTAQSRYAEVKATNIFNKIVPTYLTKCNLAMKRHGLQVIHINPHMCQLLTKLGFGTVDEKKLRVLRTYSTSVQLRTALQLRNLLAQIIVKHENAQEMEADSVCTLDADLIRAILAEEQQTALLGVHRAKTDVVTSLLTFRPSSTNDAVVDNPELTDLWAARKLAFIDLGCAPSANTMNKRLKQRPAHAELLLYYALLNIIAASAKRARKYSGVCATLAPGSVLEAPLKGIGFREFKWASNPATVTYALYGDDAFVQLIDAVDQKIDAVTSPYMTELCKGGVCK